MKDLEQAIRERAYHLWIAEGCPEGNAEAHWLSAQRDVLVSSLEEFGRVTVSEVNKATRKAKTKTWAKRTRAA